MSSLAERLGEAPVNGESHGRKDRGWEEIIPGGGGGTPLEVEDEGISLDTDVSKINFIGAGVTAVENVDHEIDVTIAGGSGLALGETDTTAYRGDRGKTAYDHSQANGSDHANVALNDTHRGSDGKNHSDVVLNNTHRNGNGADHANVALNDTHRSTTTGNPHNVNKSDVALGNVDNLQQIPLTQKGASNGVAELDGSGTVPADQLPNSVKNGIRVIGFWNASTNTPDLSLLSLSDGESYQVSVTGSTSLNGETNWKARDLVVWEDGLAGNWFKIDNTDEVLSVNSQTGVVVLDTDDVLEGSNEYYTEAKVNANTNVAANTAHRSSDGKNHSDVVLNNTHRGSAGTDHSDVGLNNTHRSSDGKNHSDVVANNAKVSATTSNIDSAGAVMETDYNANTVLAANSDNTPLALTVGVQTLIGRITAGNIAALTPAQVRTLLGLVIGTDVHQFIPEVTSANEATFNSGNPDGTLYILVP